MDVTLQHGWKLLYFNLESSFYQLHQSNELLASLVVLSLASLGRYCVNYVMKEMCLPMND